MDEDQALFRQILDNNFLEVEEKKQVHKWFMRLRGGTGERRNIHSLVHMLKDENTGLYVAGSSVKYLGYEDIDIIYIEPTLVVRAGLADKKNKLETRFTVEYEKAGDVKDGRLGVERLKCRSLTGGAEIDLLIPAQAHYQRTKRGLDLETFEAHMSEELEEGEYLPLFRGRELEEDTDPAFFLDPRDKPVIGY